MKIKFLVDLLLEDLGLEYDHILKKKPEITAGNLLRDILEFSLTEIQEKYQISASTLTRTMKLMYPDTPGRWRATLLLNCGAKQCKRCFSIKSEEEFDEGKDRCKTCYVRTRKRNPTRC